MYIIMCTDGRTYMYTVDFISVRNFRLAFQNFPYGKTHAQTSNFTTEVQYVDKIQISPGKLASKKAEWLDPRNQVERELTTETFGGE